jgi:hypothetical protein
MCSDTQTSSLRVITLFLTYFTAMTVWKWSMEKRYNKGLYKLFKEQNIVQSIKINKLKWLGHITRTDKSLFCRILTFSQLEGSRKEGKPKLWWLDYVLQDLKTLKVTAWWTKAQDRDSWKAVIKEAKAHKGL